MGMAYVFSGLHWQAKSVTSHPTSGRADWMQDV